MLTVQKKPHVRHLPTRNSGPGDGCANFVGAWHFVVLSAGSAHAHNIALLGRGVWVFLEGGGVEVPILFVIGAAISLIMLGRYSTFTKTTSLKPRLSKPTPP